MKTWKHQTLKTYFVNCDIHNFLWTLSSNSFHSVNCACAKGVRVREPFSLSFFGKEKKVESYPCPEQAFLIFIRFASPPAGKPSRNTAWGLQICLYFGYKYILESDMPVSARQLCCAFQMDCALAPL